jgi:transcriptional regulator with XRE-family HTH domain
MEFDRRRARNRRYSLRSFARFLGMDHSTLSQILRGKRRLTTQTVRAIGPMLGLSAVAITAHGVLENEQALLRAIARPGFRADSRWLAVNLGIPLDQVNVALQGLLRRRLLIMVSSQRWVSIEEAYSG